MYLTLNQLQDQVKMDHGQELVFVLKKIIKLGIKLILLLPVLKKLLSPIEQIVADKD